MTPLSRKPHYPSPETPTELVKLLAWATLELWDACVVGNPAPRVQEIYEEMSNPKPGDIVLEISSAGQREWPQGKHLGRLLLRCKAMPRTEEEWTEAEGAGDWKMDSRRGYGPYWYVDPLDGSQRRRWSNAQFIRVPSAQERVGGPAVFTRESLRGQLAHSGFELKEKP